MGQDNNGNIPELESPIEWEAVHSAVRLSANNKAGGPDAIRYELLQHAGIGAAVAITALYNYVWNHDVWPEKLQRAVMVALLREKTRRPRRVTTA